MLAYDIETCGIEFRNPRWLHEQDLMVHCLCIRDTETGETWEFLEDAIADGVALLGTQRAIGQNVQAFDGPVLWKLYGYQYWDDLDTKVLSELVFGDDLRWIDMRNEQKQRRCPPKSMWGAHSLEAWGHRMGEYKDDFAKRCKDAGVDPWSADLPPELARERVDYCHQDVEVTAKLAQLFCERDVIPSMAADIECRVAGILFRQYVHGFRFDVPAAEALTAQLMSARAKARAEVDGHFAPFYVRGGPVKAWKRDMTRKGQNGEREQLDAGAKVQPVKLVAFNPGSESHIANRLQTLYGWQPTEFTPTGAPKVSESTLTGLDYPPIKALLRWMMLDKRLQQLAEGNQAWLKVERNGRIHGRVKQNGARTRRMTHNNPNVAQVPRVGSPFGAECRALFLPDDGDWLVGADADGLELRLMASYMARWDAGEYGKAVVEGRKEDGTDAHSVNQRGFKFNSRDSAKTGFYAMIYGAGDEKMGWIAYLDMTDAQRSRFGEPTTAKLKKLGKERRAALMAGLPALDELVKRVSKTAEKRKGVLKSPDGWRWKKVAPRVALNTLLQGVGALVMKLALVLADDELVRQQGLKPKGLWGDEGDFEWVANVHDECQATARTEELARQVGQVLCNSIVRAGEQFALRVPMAGTYDVGKSWKETH